MALLLWLPWSPAHNWSTRGCRKGKMDKNVLI